MQIENHVRSLQIVLDPFGITNFRAPQSPSNERSPTTQIVPAGKVPWDQAIRLISPTWHEHHCAPENKGDERGVAVLQYILNITAYICDNFDPGFNKTDFSKELLGVIDF